MMPNDTQNTGRPTPHPSEDPRLGVPLERIDHDTIVSPGACPGCEDCGLADLESADDDPDRYEIASEPHFSWGQCDACRTTLGGDRYPAHALHRTNSADVSHLSVCPDCYTAAAYGVDEALESRRNALDH